MKTQIRALQLNIQEVDGAAETIQSWLETAGVGHRDILRIRLTMEEMLAAVCSHGEGSVPAELRFGRRFGDWRLVVRYGGERFDPTAPKENELEGWTADLLARTGFVPAWRWRANQNELILRIPGKKNRPELLMLACLGAAIVIGLLGQFVPEGIRIGMTDYVLSFLSNGFLNLLNTFIGLMIFLSIITGICGIGSARSFGRIGKLMISRFVIQTFLICAVLSLAVTAVYLAVVCRKLKVKASVLLPKLLPDFLIALSTSSSSAAFATSMEINETKLGIDPSFSRTAIPIGGLLFAGGASMFYILPGVFLAEYYGVETDITWWIILWFVGSLLVMATPPVAGGMISCLSILILQLHIPGEGLVLGTSLAMLMDFICSAFRVMQLHLELLLQSDRLGLLDREILYREERK